MSRPIVAVRLLIALLAGLGAWGIGSPPAQSASSPTTIRIQSDADFRTCGCVASGTGTAADPYVLAGLTLVSQPAPGLLVDNTRGQITKYFTIQATTVTGGNGPPTSYPGLEFRNVNGLGKILGAQNTFNGNQYGILLQDSTNILIDGGSATNGATVNSNGADGIAISGGGGHTIRNLTVNHNGLAPEATFTQGGVGIRLTNTTDNTVTNVGLSEDAWAGIALFAAANNTLDSLSVHYPDFYGAVIDGGAGNILRDSVLQTADYVGLWVRNQASNNQIVGNTISSNGPTGNEIQARIVPYFTSGLYLSSGAQGNAVRRNTLQANTGSSIIQDNGAIINVVQQPVQSQNQFNDPTTGNEPKRPLSPAGLDRPANTFCGNVLQNTQGVPGNPAAACP